MDIASVGVSPFFLLLSFSVFLPRTDPISVLLSCVSQLTALLAWKGAFEPLRHNRGVARAVPLPHRLLLLSLEIFLSCPWLPWSESGVRIRAAQ